MISAKDNFVSGTVVEEPPIPTVPKVGAMRRDLVWLCEAIQNIQRFSIASRVRVVDIGNEQVG
jgi:hypothetical protein